MVDKVEAAVDTSVAPSTSTHNHGDVTMVTKAAPTEESEHDKAVSVVDAEGVPMDESKYSTIGPDAVQKDEDDASPMDNDLVPMDEAESRAGRPADQTGDDVSLTIIADSGSMDVILPSKTIDDASSNTDIDIDDAPPSREVFPPRFGEKRKAFGEIEEVNTTHTLDVNASIFNMAGSAFDAELSRTLEDFVLKVDRQVYDNQWFSAFSLGGMGIQHWVPRLMSRIHNMFFSEKNNDQLVPKWRDSSKSDFQKEFQKVMQVAMPSTSIWILGQWIRDVMLPILVDELKLTLIPWTLGIDTSRTSEEKLKMFNHKAVSEDKRRIGVWKIFEALVGAHLHMILYFAQHPDNRCVSPPEFAAVPWKLLKQKALSLERECAVDAALKRSPYATPYHIDAIVSSTDGYKSLARNIAHYKSEHYLRPAGYEPHPYMSSVKAHKDHFNSLHQFVSDGGVIDEMYEIRAKSLDGVFPERATELEVTFDQRLKVVRKTFVLLTLTDDMWNSAMGASVVSPSPVGSKDVIGAGSKSALNAAFLITKKFEMSIIEAIEKSATDVVMKGTKHHAPTPASVIYDRRARDDLSSLIDRPIETLKKLAMDYFPHVRKNMPMDPQKYHLSLKHPDEPVHEDDWVDLNWRSCIGKIDQPRVKRRRTHKEDETDDDPIERDWNYMAPRLGLRESDKWPWGTLMTTTTGATAQQT